MKVVDGGFNKKPEKAKASDVLQSTADMMEEMEEEGAKADVVVILQMADSPAFVVGNTSSDRASVLMDFAKNDTLMQIYYSEYVTEEPDDDDTVH